MIAELARFPYLWLIVLLFGLAVGSFLNVCIWRIPRNASIVSPGSSCPRCGNAIRWRDNIPIVSWLRLRGRCRQCRASISARYPAVEALNALLWLLLWARFGPTLTLVLFLPFASFLLVLFFTDLDLQLLPHALTFPLAALGLLVAHWNERLDVALPGAVVDGPRTRVVASVFGAALGYALFWAVGKTWELLRGQDAMGGGDLMLMLGVGAWLGPQGVVLTTFLGSVAGALIAVPLLLLSNARRARAGSGPPGGSLMTTEIAFGCFLAPAALLATLHGPEIVAWYLELTGLPVSSS